MADERIERDLVDGPGADHGRAVPRPEDGAAGQLGQDAGRPHPRDVAPPAGHIGLGYEPPSRVELYRQVNRAERVAREEAAAAVVDVLDAIGWAVLTAGAVLIFAAEFGRSAA